LPILLTPFRTTLVIMAVIMAVVSPFHGRMPFLRADTDADMLAGMVNHDVSWTGIGIYPYVQL
jgi:hypothetical protein